MPKIWQHSLAKSNERKRRLSRPIVSCIGEQDPPQRDAGGPQEATEMGVVSLPSETLKTAQEAAKAAGEGLLQFVARAIESRATLDKRKRG